MIWKSFELQLNHLSANPTKWSNTQTIRRQQPTNCLSVFDHFVGLALKGLDWSVCNYLGWSYLNLVMFICMHASAKGIAIYRFCLSCLLAWCIIWCPTVSPSLNTVLSEIWTFVWRIFTFCWTITFINVYQVFRQALFCHSRSENILNKLQLKISKSSNEAIDTLFFKSTQILA